MSIANVIASATSRRIFPEGFSAGAAMKPLSQRDFRPALVPLSWLYGIGVGIRNFFFDAGLFRIRRVKAVVISVGNISAGGTGKTPIVAMLAQQFVERRRNVAIVSRGYKRVSRGLVEVSDGTTIKASVEEAGDEPLQIARGVPSVAVVVDERRVRGAQYASEKFGAELILLDDGFQHRHLHRDCDLIVLDASQSPFETALLPAGNRREQLGSLKRADAVVITRAASEASVDDIRTKIRRFGDAEIFTCSFQTNTIRDAKERTVIGNEIAKQKRILAFCGIGNPKSFRKSLEENRMNVLAVREFPDHHRYSPVEINALQEEMKRSEAEVLLTTEKDAVRLSNKDIGFDAPLWFLEMKAKINEEEKWKAFISSVIGSV
ncbi:MAG: tetraacyldisaccharide 4'-kinase [Bacteroidota bacterium]|nr:tetraacyldisaccharide 4'-kinase [Bacteroidota bacterium]